jgi:hypothetical protein
VVDAQLFEAQVQQQMRGLQYRFHKLHFIDSPPESEARGTQTIQV